VKKRAVDKFWFPWWPDKWIFGSVRIEFTPAERGIWVDLLSLASKDEGHIRANPETPYPLQQLSGMLIIPEDELKNAIEKFINTKDEEGNGKLTRLKTGTLYVTKWDKYQFGERHKRRIEETMAGKSASMAGKSAPILENSKVKNSKVKYNKEKQEKLLDIEFEEFWKFYYQMGNKGDDPGDKDQAKKAYKILRRTETKGTVIKATNKYSDFLKHKELKEGFKQRKMYASTFLRSKKWKRFLDFKYTPSL